MSRPNPDSAPGRNVTRLSHLDLPGAGQVYVAGNYAYVGHVPNDAGLGTSIIDVADPAKPRIVSQIPVGDPGSQSHKARVIGDIMIVNMEQKYPKMRTALQAALGRDPTRAELAAKLGVGESDIPASEAAEEKPYDQGGFKIYNVADPARPKLITHCKTAGIGVHRFDMDADYAYISTEMPGYLGHILVVFDIRNPAKPDEISRWWLPGQHVAGGEKPAWAGRQHRLHHALKIGNRLWAGCWHGGIRVIDATDIRKPWTIGEYNYHPPFIAPCHTFMGLPKPIAGRSIAVAIDEEPPLHSADDMVKRFGRPHACLWVFDVTELPKVQPLAIHEVSELDSPWSRAAPGRFGAHQFQEHTKGGDTLIYCAWFGAGLRILDVRDPAAPREVGYYIPEPAPGKVAPQTNDVDVDERGLVYIGDRYAGFEILEFRRPGA